MRRRTTAATLLTAIVVVSACSDRTSTAPAAAPRASLTGVTCSFSTMKSDARAYFRSSQDPVFGIIQNMQSAYKTSAAAATPFGLQIAKRIETALSTSPSPIDGTPTNGANLMVDVIACSELTVQTSLLSTGITPQQALTKALTNPGGLFAVRGDDTNDGSINPATVRVPSGALWGTEPDYTSPATWSGSTGGNRIVIFGYENSTNPLAFELAVLAPANNATFGFNPNVIVGACLNPGNGVRVQHTNTLLPQKGVDFCSTLASAASMNGGFLASVRRVWNALMPQDLYAATMLGVIGSGGGIGGYSPFYIGAINAQLTFAQQPTDGFTNTPIPVQVLVQAPSLNPADNGALVPLVGVSVTLNVVGNSGSFTASGTGPSLTNSSGIASFPNFQLDKAGGYTITATLTDDTYSKSSGPSNLFNLQQKK